MAFQQVMRNQPAPAFEGDFASANPYDSMYAGPGELVAGPNGVTVGRFAWAGPTGIVNNNALGVGGRVGFVGRHGQVVINPTVLQRFGNLIPAGIEVTLHTMGDFWVRFAAGAQSGQKVYANYADGTAIAAASGAPPAAASATGTIAAGTAAFTASIAPNNNYNGDVEGGIMTVTAVGTPPIVIGGTVVGAGVLAGTLVLAQLTGAAGGVGLYTVSQAQTVASEAMTETYGTFTAASGLTGTYGVGDLLSGTGVAAGTQITALGTGTGGLGTYIVNNNTVVGSTAIAAAGAVETRWTVAKTVGAGELAPMVVHP